MVKQIYMVFRYLHNFTIIMFLIVLLSCSSANCVEFERVKKKKKFN